ncbi:MAG: RNA polymerase sigma factor [Azonexus sp.]|jgi:RNA polymerase sigma-70 factor (ECF subfamily)|uniref:RNA polymerase sigma factor n=1 Tax=Azonexus sp. TaxID=1872668 RepID=UPI0028393958|nr:RNA polymerase sigma factor [Azonexus sp.]MDR0777104.1 RNA polymerase sigma factor [Azonexus sp.]
MSSPVVAAARLAVADPDGDEALLARYREGDEEAFAELYRRHRGGLYRFIHGLCSSTARADEIFQETWFALIRSDAMPDGRARFKTWLYQIARHRLIDQWRRDEGATEAFDEAEHTLLDEHGNSAAETPETLVLRAEQLQQIVCALETLPLPQREVFLLRAHAGMELAEIAALTATSLEAIKSRYRYALARLRQRLGSLSPAEVPEPVELKVPA